DFRPHASAARSLIEQLLAENPHTTLQVILEPGHAGSVTPALLSDLTRACYRRTTYLDRFYSILPGPMKGSKRLILLLGEEGSDGLAPECWEAIGEYATIARRSGATTPRTMQHSV